VALQVAVAEIVHVLPPGVAGLVVPSPGLQLVLLGVCSDPIIALPLLIVYHQHPLFLWGHVNDFKLQRAHLRTSQKNL
jgi:hypothetical protein